MGPSLLPTALAAYGVGLLLVILTLAYDARWAWRAASVLFAAGFAAHLGAVVLQGVAVGGLPLSNRAEYLLLLGCCVMALHLWIWFGLHVTAAGLLLPPLAAALTIASMTGLARQPVPSAATDSWFLFHTTTSTLGMATLCVALAMSLVYLAQDRALKSRRALQVLDKLPPLEHCDRLAFHALRAGFALLSIGIATGLIVNASVHRRFWVHGPKQLLPILAWLVFAGVLAARVRLGLRGRKSAYLTIAGVMLGLLSVVGMTL
jgi:ABC-type uncharacterized transport system permease subunit